jgi:uncharacterized repeat protein (TIGR03803 family)
LNITILRAKGGGPAATFAPAVLTVYLASFASTAEAQTNFQVIKILSDVAAPTALIEGSDGVLYGTTTAGGAPEGVVFKLNKDGSGWSVLHGFGGAERGGDGAKPQGLVELSDGMLYGTTSSGGTPGRSRGLFDYSLGCGTVFQLHKDGSGYSILHRFAGDEGNGASPTHDLVEGMDGALYGVTSESGPDPGKTGYGIFFKLQKNGTGYALVHRFGLQAGDGVWERFLLGRNGTLFGASREAVYKWDPLSSKSILLHSFMGEAPPLPPVQLLEGRDGALYGTTSSGGTNSYGSVFSLNEDGRGYQVLHHFVATSGQEISDPVRGLVGVRNGVPSRTSWTGGDGATPTSLLEGRDGWLFGSTQNGGKHGGGTIFRISRDGSNFTVLHSFSMTDGSGNRPCVLLEAKDGVLYGATEDNFLQLQSGAEPAPRGPTIFKLSFSQARPASDPAPER